MKTYYIYTLSNPNNGEIFYVGCTIDAERRQKAHCILQSNQPPAANFGMTGKDGYVFHHRIDPVLEIIESFECDNVKDAERLEEYWMHQFKSWGFKLYNKFRNENLSNYVREKCLKFYHKKYLKLINKNTLLQTA